MPLRPILELCIIMWAREAPEINMLITNSRKKGPNAPKKAQLALREMVLKLYDEGSFAVDDFYRRHNSGSKKEVSNKDFNEKAVQMAMALQQRLAITRNQTELLSKDFEVFHQAMVSLQKARLKQLADLQGEKAGLKATNDEMYERLQQDNEKLKNMKTEHEAEMHMWKKRNEAHRIEKDQILKQRRWLEMQLRSDRQRASEFMARMLQKEHQLQELKELVPQCNMLTEELRRVTEENKKIFELLKTVLNCMVESTPKEITAAHACRATGLELERLFQELQVKYNQVCQDADMFVEDVYPYEKVARRPKVARQSTKKSQMNKS